MNKYFKVVWLNKRTGELRYQDFIEAVDADAAKAKALHDIVKYADRHDDPTGADDVTIISVGERYATPLGGGCAMCED